MNRRAAEIPFSRIIIGVPSIIVEQIPRNSQKDINKKMKFHKKKLPR